MNDGGAELMPPAGADVGILRRDDPPAPIGPGAVDGDELGVVRKQLGDGRRGRGRCTPR